MMYILLLDNYFQLKTKFFIYCFTFEHLTSNNLSQVSDLDYTMIKITPKGLILLKVRTGKT